MSQLDIAKKIHSSGADYLLAVKQNQPNLADEIANFFDQATQATEYAPVMGIAIKKKSAEGMIIRKLG